MYSIKSLKFISAPRHDVFTEQGSVLDDVYHFDVKELMNRKLMVKTHLTFMLIQIQYPVVHNYIIGSRYY